jgi:RNA polymerase sigma-70 factor (ECF subfamily)
MSERAVLTHSSDLESVYRSDGRRLWCSLVAFCGDRDVADEAVAEAYAQALRRGGELRHPDRWVWKAAFRIAAGDLQRRRRSRPLQDRVVVHNPEPAWDLIDALGRLSERQRACLILHYYVGFSSIEIARLTDSTPPAVRMHLSRGRRRLGSILEGGES